MSHRIVLALGLIAAAVSGCVHEADIKIQNPITTHSIETNRIVRDHEYAEQQNGLPPGSISDEAVLIAANPKQVCFQVTMKGFNPVDLRRVEAKMVVPKRDPVEGASVEAGPPTMQTFNGLVAERRESGSETICVSRDSNNNCLRWRTQPTYVTVMVPGPVNVHTAKGTLCFANKGLLTASTPQISIELAVPLIGRTGMFGSTETKDEDFTWGFLGSAQGGTVVEEEEGNGEVEKKKPVKAGKAKPKKEVATDD